MAMGRGGQAPPRRHSLRGRARKELPIPPCAFTELPGPRGLPLIGSLRELVADPLSFFSQLAQEHGDLVRFRIGSRQMLLVTEPEAIAEVLITHRKATRKDPITRSLSDLLGEGLLTADHATWKQSRRLLAPTFRPQHLAGFADTMVRCAERAVESLEEGAQDIHARIMPLTLDIAVRTLFGGAEGGVGRVGELTDEMMWAFHLQIHSWRRLVPRWVPLDTTRRMRRARAEFDAIVDRIVAARRAQDAGEDLLARMLAARDDAGRGMDEAQLRDEAITLLIAGHETTALTLSFALLLLAEHPEVQEGVRAELSRELGDRRPGAADARGLPLTHAVIRESMRLYPPAWMIGREALEPLQVGEVQVPRSTALLMPQWVVHRDPRWFVEPLAFRPRRWLSGEVEDLPRFAFFPFGGGPRVCIGTHFAQMEAVLVLAVWLRHMELRALPGFAPELLASATLRPQTGVQVEIRRRAPPTG